MEMPTYASRLRYLEADDVDDAAVHYDGLAVLGKDGQTIGSVDGFIVDPDARRVNYIVVDSGGWFSSRRLLLPIGHAAIAADRRSLETDVAKDALSRLPEFYEDRFRSFSDEDLRAFERSTVLACCPDEPHEPASSSTWDYETRRHFTQPSWWRTHSYAPERLRPLGAGAGGPGDPTAPAPPAPVAPAARDTYNREAVTARERSEGDVSPHLDGRAQPGDVLGIETGGERTGIGDAAEDEDKTRKRS